MLRLRRVFSRHVGIKGAYMCLKSCQGDSRWLSITKSGYTSSKDDGNDNLDSLTATSGMAAQRRPNPQ